MNAADAADITVTTATRSEAQVRESLGMPAVAPAVPAAAPDPKVVEDEANSQRPDPEVSEAARVMRRSRADNRKAKIQTEIDDLTRRKHATAAEVEALERKKAELATPPPAERKPAEEHAPAAAPPAAPTFTFPNFEQYQEAHPDADYDTYIRAAVLAEVKQNQQNDRDAQAREHAERAEVARAASFETSQTTFRDTHADYDAVLEQVNVPRTPATEPIKRKDGTTAPPPLLQLIHGDPTKAPAILYYLGQHADAVERLAHAPNADALIFEFGQVVARVFSTPPSAAATVVAKPPPAPASPPSIPITDASAPLTPVPGGASHTRSAAALAADSDDADAYIAKRRLELQRTG